MSDDRLDDSPDIAVKLEQMFNADDARSHIPVRVLFVAAGQNKQREHL